MATIAELLKSGNRFMFREKEYKLLSYIPSPVIEMISEDGKVFSFGVDGRIKDDFVLYSSDS